MRVMVLVKATKDSEAGIMPSIELLEAMGKYNQELVDAGILAHDVLDRLNEGTNRHGILLSRILLAPPARLSC